MCPESMLKVGSPTQIMNPFPVKRAPLVGLEAYRGANCGMVEVPPDWQASTGIASTQPELDDCRWRHHRAHCPLGLEVINQIIADRRVVPIHATPRGTHRWLKRAQCLRIAGPCDLLQLTSADCPNRVPKSDPNQSAVTSSVHWRAHD